VQKFGERKSKGENKRCVKIKGIKAIHFLKEIWEEIGRENFLKIGNISRVIAWFLWDIWD